MRKKFYRIAAALAITMGCSIFMTGHSVQAAEVQTSQQEDENDFILPNGDKFQTSKMLKNGKTIKFYDLHMYTDGKTLYGKAMYNGEEFKIENYEIATGAAFIENPEYNDLDKSTQKFRAIGTVETYFPALTATKKVNDLINKYKDPSQHLLPEKVDKTSTVYKEMEAAADAVRKR